MSRTAAIYVDRKRTYARVLCESWGKGLARHGIAASITAGRMWCREVEADIAIFYGLRKPYDRMLELYRQNDTAVCMDRGYWRRKINGDKLQGYYKVTVNDNHPTEYFRRGLSSRRFERLSVGIKPWRVRGDRFIVAGMSGASAQFHGFEPEAWERAACERLHACCDVEVVYRPKPGWKKATRIDGTTHSEKREDIAGLLETARAVVTHHSNVAIEALLSGVPIFCESGPASLLSPPRLEDVLEPAEPEGVAGFAADLAYCQWTAAEMAAGDCWAHFQSQGLV